MGDITKFRPPDKKPTDILEAKDPLPPGMTARAREIYLRIIRESEPGVLLVADRLAVEAAARCVDDALSEKDGGAHVPVICESFESLLLPRLGLEYSSQVLRKV